MHTLLAKLLRMMAGLAVAVPTLGCTPARLLNAVISKDGYRIERGIAYDDEQRQKFDLYVPNQPLHPAKVVVFFYGGRWGYGSRNDFQLVGQALTDAINASGGDAAIRTYNRIGHFGIILSLASPFRWLAPVLDDIVDYLDRSRTTRRRAA